MGKNSKQIYHLIGKRIRDLRKTNGRGVSQKELAAAIKVGSNAVSRWETAACKPTLIDLEKMADFFNEPITTFFVDFETTPALEKLINATTSLHDREIDEITLYVLFRKARRSKKSA